MGIKNIKMKNVQISLVGLSGEQVSTMGTICLPVYAEGVNLMVRFMVVDCRSAYNTILGRPWMHAVKAVHLSSGDSFPNEERSEGDSRISKGI